MAQRAEPALLDGVDPGLARHALRRVLASPLFAEAEQLRRLLDYLVEKTMSGEADRLKAYTIAVEALGRSPSFDAQNDSSVRVLAARLRRVLTLYRSTEGRDDPLHIDLPAGHYRIRFIENRIAAEGERPTSAHRAASAPAWRRLAWLFCALALIGIAGIGPASFLGDEVGSAEVTNAIANFDAVRPNASLPDPVPSPLRTRRPLIVVARPEADAGPLPDGRTMADFVAELAAALARFDDLLVVRLDLPEGRGANRRIVDDVAGREIYRLSIHAHDVSAGIARAVLVLTHRDSGDVVSSNEVGGDTDAWRHAFESEGMVGRSIATLAAPYGVIFADAHRRASRDTVPDASYPCLREVFEYWLRPVAGRFGVAETCLNAVVAAQPRFSPAYANLAFLKSEGIWLGFAPDREAAAHEALRFARLAVETAPASARAHSALAAAFVAGGDLDAALAVAERALDMNPLDPELRADRGIKRCLVGRMDECLGDIERAVDSGGAQPARRRFVAAIAAALLGRPEIARRHAELMKIEAGPYRSIALIAAANAAGDPAAAAGLAATFRRDYPREAKDIAATLARRLPAPRQVARILPLLMPLADFSKSFRS